MAKELVCPLCETVVDTKFKVAMSGVVCIELDESDRGMLLLGLAFVARLRPGFDFAAGLVADKMFSREMFEKFKELNPIPAQHEFAEIEQMKHKAELVRKQDAARAHEEQMRLGSARKMRVD